MKRRLSVWVLLSYGGLLSASSNAAPAYQCLIEPYRTVDVRSTVVGVIDKIYVKRGDRIKTGEVLVALESSSERASLELARYIAQMTGQLSVAQTKFEYATRTFNRRRDMHAEKMLSAQDKDEAEGDMKSAEAELKLAQENHQAAQLELKEQEAQYERRTIRSTLDGVVADQVLHEGEVVDPSDQKQPILRVAQLNPLRVHLILPRAVYGQIKLGMPATITPEAPAGGRLSGTVRVLDSLVDAASGTFSAFLDVPNQKLDTPSGLRCQVDFANVALTSAISSR